MLWILTGAGVAVVNFKASFITEQQSVRTDHPTFITYEYVVC
jgi:hypothetical protein